MGPQQNQPMPTFILQNQPEHQNTLQSFRFCQNQQTNLNIEQGEKSNKQSSDLSKKYCYVGNLSPVVTQDSYELFGFKTNIYL